MPAARRKGACKCRCCMSKARSGLGQMGWYGRDEEEEEAAGDGVVGWWIEVG